jgi:4-hydroxy-tetrahydrodipicolinate synthase
MDFKGSIVALITPFTEHGVDEWALEKLVDFQIKNGSSGIVPCGTTGESPTLSHEEHDRVIEITTDTVRKRVPVIAGTGSNSTAEAIRLTRHAEEAGADAALVVTPYYNKPTQKGLYLHFKAVADSVKIPLILYNIESRCGRNIETPTVQKLVKDCKNIIGVKEAAEVVELMARGHIKEAEAKQEALMPLIKAMFIETNPIPVKTACSLMGLCHGKLRLPLCEMEPENLEKLKSVLKQYKLI